ncbi:MAG: hypothetical protein HC809_04875 [Gammaproteobacteria bacterium]|nr:hypothetical protein [Gammaproteobacteria bacterium]
MSKILRPLALLVNLLAIVLATVTLAGRVLVTWVDEFEGEINALLSPRDVELRGLAASWHGLNPVITATSVRFPGGHVANAAVELDLIETALNSAVVARYLSLESLKLMVVRSADGRWGLAGGGRPQGDTFNALPLLMASDQLAIERIEVALAREPVDAPLEVLTRLEGRLQIRNENRRHGGDVRLAFVQPDCESCELRLRWQLTDGGFGFGIGLDGSVALDGDGFEVPVTAARALGLGGGRFDTLRGRWAVADGDGIGSLELHARDVGLPRGSLDDVAFHLEASSALWHRDWHGRIASLDVRAGDHAGRLEDVGLGVLQGLTGTSLDFSVRDVDLGNVAPVVRAALADVPVAVEWLDALLPRAAIEHLSGRFSFERRELSAVADVTDIAVENYKGVPRLRNVAARLVGNERGFEATVDGRDATLGLMDIYDTPMLLDAVQGTVRLWFKDKFLVVRGDDIDARFAGARAMGGFSLSRPEDKQEQRISVWLSADQLDAPVARGFVPRKLSPELISWLDRAVIAGVARDARVVYYGHIRATEGLPMRQAEVQFQVDGGAIRFHEDWPLAAALDGQVSITASGVDAWLDRGMIRGIAVRSGRLRSPRGGGYIDVEGQGSGSAEAVRDLIEDSPLAETLSFIGPDWRFRGPLSYGMSMRVPLKQVPGEESALAVELEVDLDGVDVDLGAIGLVFTQLDGPVSYRYPYSVTAPAVQGQMFGKPARFSSSFDQERVVMVVDGHADVADVANWLQADVGDTLAGQFEFDSEFSVWPGTQRAPRLAVTTDLEGVAINLPLPFAKAPAAVTPARLEVEIRDDGMFLGGHFDQWLKLWARRPTMGAIAGHVSVNAALPAEDASVDRIVVTGALDELPLDDWISAFGASARAGLDAATAGNVPLRVSVADFSFGRVAYRDTQFESVVANAEIGADGVDLTVSAPAISGRLQVPGKGVIGLDLDHLKLPAGDADSTDDPLANFDPSFISAADVVVRGVEIGDQPYGTWRFKARNSDSVMVVSELEGTFRGLDIVGTSPLQWRFGAEPSTTLIGRVSATNLDAVLPQFGYAPSVETKSVVANLDVTWPGSPLNFSLARLEGKLDVRAEKGRFVDVESGSGAMRVFSLLNFTTIAKRMTLDFSDVFGKGISFDELTAGLAVDNGKMHLADPMVIDGSGAYFRVSGNVDYHTGQLDNEMVVTLPVSSSLPWYAAYLSIINPIAAGAVLVGERLFRNQIDQLSSATYKISGTLDDPKVEFVKVFGRGSDNKPAPAPAVTTEPAKPATPPSVEPAAEEPT